MTDETQAWLERSLDRHYVWGLVFMAALLAAFVLYQFQEPGLRDDAEARQQREYTRLGDKLFEQNCADCHGEAGTGGDAPTLNSEEFLKSASDEEIELVTAGGVSGTDMDPWINELGGPLTKAQISQVTTYLRSLEENAPSVPGWRQGDVAVPE